MILLKEMQVVEFAKNYEFITKMMLSSICIFATFGNEGCCVHMPEALYKKRFTRIILLH